MSYCQILIHFHHSVSVWEPLKAKNFCTFWKTKRPARSAPNQRIRGLWTFDFNSKICNIRNLNSTKFFGLFRNSRRNIMINHNTPQIKERSVNWSKVEPRLACRSTRHYLVEIGWIQKHSYLAKKKTLRQQGKIPAPQPVVAMTKLYKLRFELDPNPPYSSNEIYWLFV